MRRRTIGFGYTLVGSIGFAPWLGSYTRLPGYLYLRVWRFWVRIGTQRSVSATPAQVLAARLGS